MALQGFFGLQGSHAALDGGETDLGHSSSAIVVRGSSGASSRRPTLPLLSSLPGFNIVTTTPQATVAPGPRYLLRLRLE